MRRTSSPPWRPLVLLLVAIVVGPTRAAQESGDTRVFRYLMGTSMQVRAIGGDDTSRRAAIDDAFAAMAEVDRLMSNYRSDSELTRVNREAARRPVVVSDPLLQVIQAAQRVSADSDGAFDITVGPLVRLWGFRTKNAHIPSAAELAVVRPLVDYRGVVVDAPHHTVWFARPGIEIDLGGIAKGFAVEVAGNVLRQHHLTGFIDAGGNQYMLGAPPGKSVWTVGIKNPEHPDRLLGVVEVDSGSVSTSADDGNFLRVGERTYGHLLDPRTLQPSTASLSATIVSRDGTLADAMSKAAFVLGPRQGIALIDGTPGMAGVIVYRAPDGSIGVAVSQRAVWRRVQ